MQAGGDEQTVQEGIDASADAAHADDAVAQGNQRAEDDGPDKDQNDGDHDGDQAGGDGDKALAAEEGQPVRQLGVLELVVAGRAHDGGQDADKGVAGDLAEGDVIHGAFFQGAHRAHNAGVEQLLHHQEADQTGQTGGAVMVVGQTHGGANGEQPCHIVNQSAACLDEQEADGVSNTACCAFRAHNGGSQRVANAHQNTADGQRGDRQHHCLAELLQPFHHKKHSSCKNSVPGHKHIPRRTARRSGSAKGNLMSLS